MDRSRERACDFGDRRGVPRCHREGRSPTAPEAGLRAVRAEGVGYTLDRLGTWAYVSAISPRIERPRASPGIWLWATHSFTSQGHNWIDARSASRRNERRNDRCHEEK